MKRAFVMFLAALMLMSAVSAVAEEELRGYEKGEGYQYVHFGEYPYERKGGVQPVLWRVLEVKDGRMLLLTEYIIDAQQVIFETDKKVIEKRTYRRIKTYEESDLYTWMNTEALDTLLGDSPMRQALIEEEGGGKFFIMTDEQFLTTEYGFSADRWDEQITRQASVTPYAKARGVYESGENGKASYWVNAVKGEDDYKFQLMGYNGHMSWGAYTRVNVGIRPSVRLDLSLLEVTGGTGTKKDPFVISYAGTAVQEAVE